MIGFHTLFSLNHSLYSAILARTLYQFYFSLTQIFLLGFGLFVIYLFFILLLFDPNLVAEYCEVTRSRFRK